MNETEIKARLYEIEKRTGELVPTILNLAKKIKEASLENTADALPVLEV